MKVVFDVQHLYYLPQYLPVIDVLKRFTQEIKLTGYKSNDLLLNKIVKKSFYTYFVKYLMKYVINCFANHVTKHL